MKVEKKEKKSTEIDLSEHKNPEELFKRMRERFSDEDVDLVLNEQNAMQVSITENVPSQLQVDILSFLRNYVEQEIIFG